jgi:hypothetical protein
MARGKKIGVIALFATCALCIIIATLRVAQITHNVNKYDQGIDGTWLAIWGMVECSIGQWNIMLETYPFSHTDKLLLAVLVGFSPPFAVLIRVTRDKKSSYNMYGYKKQPNSRSGEGQSGFVMNTISSKTTRSKKKGLETTDTLWLDDTSSQEGLAPEPQHDGIMVTTTLQQSHALWYEHNYLIASLIVLWVLGTNFVNEKDCLCWGWIEPWRGRTTTVRNLDEECHDILKSSEVYLIDGQRFKCTIQLAEYKSRHH